MCVRAARSGHECIHCMYELIAGCRVRACALARSPRYHDRCCAVQPIWNYVKRFVNIFPFLLLFVWSSIYCSLSSFFCRKRFSPNVIDWLKYCKRTQYMLEKCTRREMILSRRVMSSAEYAFRALFLRLFVLFRLMLAFEILTAVTLVVNLFVNINKFVFVY